MVHRVRIACLAFLLLLTGCAGKNHGNTDMKANLEPELWDTSLILKDLKRGRPLTEQEKRALASRGSIQFNLDVKETEEVQELLQYFTQDKRGSIEKWLARAQPHLPYVRAVLASYNLPPDLIVLPIIESGYNTMAYSPVGAGGMWQFMPYTARRFGLEVDWWLDERRDPFKATVAAAKYLTKLYQMFGDWNLALAAYNAGEGKVSKAMACSGQSDFFDLARDPGLLKAETRHYVPKFLAVLKIFQNLDALGFRKINWQAGPNLKDINVPGGTDLLAMSQACNMSWEEFRTYNAAFRRQVSPPDKTVSVYVPVAKESLALAYLQHPDGRPAAGYHNYLAQSGETWWAISRRTGVPIAALREYNSSLPETLEQGQAVRIPANASGVEATALADATDACAPVRQAAAKPLRHRVNRGETIATIARKYGISADELAAANHMRSRGRLPVGKWLVIPGSAGSSRSPAHAVAQNSHVAGSRYTVRRGDSVSAIASRYGIGTDELLAANHMRSGKDLLAGQTLTIPGRGTPVAEAPSRPSPQSAANTGSLRSGSTYSVQPGDTLGSISQRAGVDMRQVQAANHMHATTVRVGEKLIIPGGHVPASPERTPKPVAVAKASAKPVAAPVTPAKPVAAAKVAVAKPAPKKAGKAVSYTVNPGETVWGIARKFNVEPSSLMAWNNMKSPSSLQAGSHITIFKE